MGPVAQSEVCATGRLCWVTSAAWLGFLDRFFGGGRLHGGGFGFGRGSHHCFGAPEVGGDFCDFVGRIAEVGGETIEGGLSGLDGIRVDLLEFLETLLTEDVAQRGIVVEAAHGRAQRGDVEGGAFASFDDLGNKYRLGIRVLFAGFFHFLGKSLELGDVSGANVHSSGTQETGLANEFGVSFGALGGLAAEVPTATAEFAAGPDQTVVEVLPHFIGSCLAKGLIDSGHDGFVGFVDIGVVLAGAGELVDIAFTIDGFESEPTVAIVAAIGISPFFGEGLEIGEFFRFHFDDENIEIVSLRLDSDGRCQAHDDS